MTEVRLMRNSLNDVNYEFAEPKYSRFSFVVNPRFAAAAADKHVRRNPYLIEPGCSGAGGSGRSAGGSTRGSAGGSAGGSSDELRHPDLHVTSAGVFKGPLYPNALATWELTLRTPEAELPVPFPVEELMLKAEVEICFKKRPFR